MGHVEDEQDDLSVIPWVSRICFIEKLEPERLCAGPRTLQEAHAGLTKLRAMDPLKAYLFCLETLTEAEEITFLDE